MSVGAVALLVIRVKPRARSGDTTLPVSKGAWVKEQKVLVADGAVNGYRVDLKVSFVLD